MRRLLILSFLPLLFACTTSDGAGGKGGAGGSTGTGGQGGSSSTGGSSGSGGSGSGGLSGSGGAGGAPGDDGGGTPDRAPGDDGGTPDRAPGADRPPDGVVGGGGTAYVFTTSSTGYGAPGRITSLKLDLATGALTKGPTTNGRSNVFYGAFSPDKKYLFTVTEEAPSAHLSSFSVNGGSGALALINDVATGASNAEHVAVHPGGQWATVAHYTGGQVTLHPVQANGTVGAPADTKVAATAGAPNCHQTLFDSSGSALLVSCLGARLVAQFRLMNNMLIPNTPATVSVSGQIRHLAFGMDELFAYGVTEVEATLVTFTYDKAAGRLATVGSPIPAFVTEAGGGGHVIVHPSGKFLFVSSRFDNKLVTFSINAGTGAATMSSNTDDSLSYPRDFALDPSGAYLIAGTQPNSVATMAANKRPDGGGKLVVFRIDQNNGSLSRMGTPTTIESGSGSVWWVGTLGL
ncbi:MAG TPA: beta-propeller fold lactonase family protein [Polyangia bacterium]|nr:beta-propeller fold lactonase family protein [Polyangia bacterium]